MRINRKEKNPNDKHYIYLLKCLITNKIYVGETSDIQMRFEWHMVDGENPNHFKQKYELYQDIFRYGRENFKIKVLEECYFKDAIDREEYWISFYDSYNNGYNNAPRQYITSLGYQYSEERKKKYKEMFSGDGNPFYGKKHTEESKRKNSEKRKEWWKNLGLEERDELIETFKNRKPREKGKAVRAILEDGTIKIFKSVMAASREFNIPHNSLRGAINKNKKIKNILFEYLD